jgi:chemotaxis-related protein WspD
MSSSHSQTACWKTVGSYGDKTCAELETYGLCVNCPIFAERGRSLFDRPMPQGETELWARLLAEEKHVAPSGRSSVIVFKLRQEWLGLPTRCFEEIMDVLPVRRVPGRSNRVFRGLVNYGGELVPCMSTAAQLGLDGSKNSGENMLSLERMASLRNESGERFVIRIDEIMGVVLYQPESLREPPATLNDDSRRFSKGILEQKRFGFGFGFGSDSTPGQSSHTPNTRLDVGILDPGSLFEAFTGSMSR